MDQGVALEEHIAQHQGEDYSHTAQDVDEGSVTTFLFSFALHALQSLEGIFCHNELVFYSYKYNYICQK